jgi:hypothetical protein
MAAYPYNRSPYDLGLACGARNGLDPNPFKRGTRAYNDWLDGYSAGIARRRRS